MAFACSLAPLPPSPPHDSAVLPTDGARLAFTTDSYVVNPLFFPGGDIGKLAVCGTVNDLAMAGARPAYLSAGFILEEGLPMETLRRVVASMAEAARAAGVQLSPATPRSSIAARATASSSTPRASAGSRRALKSRPPESCPAM